jgi:hypothetical protein
LTSLIFSSPESDDLIASFIRKAPSSAVGGDGSGLRRLEIDRFEVFGEFGACSTEALLEHASTLEVVRLDMVPLMDSKVIQQFLCSAPRLKEFDIIGGERVVEGVFLDAHDVVSSDWVCTELEVFRCQIGGIPRPDITREIAGRPAIDFIKEGTLQESLDLQRGVYMQLGRLTKLKELTLGVIDRASWANYGEDDERYFQYDCLAMTLESGLDLLKGLKELWIVDLADMEESIFSLDEERAWVKKNWPRVRGF